MGQIGVSKARHIRYTRVGCHALDKLNMDIKNLRTLVDKYFGDNPEARDKGRITEKTEFENINTKVLKNIPDWYRDILMSYPLVNQEIGIPNDFGQEEYIGKPFGELPLMGLTFISVKEIEYHALQIFPDCELLDIGCIRIAEDKFSTQEGVFINSREENPSVYLLMHDFGDSGKEVLKNSIKLLDKFSDIFYYGRVRDMTGDD